MRTRDLKKEADVKAEVADVIKKLDGAFSWAPPGGAFGLAGMPDRMFIYRGVLFAIECKFGSNKPTVAQLSVLKRIVAAGGVAIIYFGGMPADLMAHIGRCPIALDGRVPMVVVMKGGDIGVLPL